MNMMRGQVYLNSNTKMLKMPIAQKKWTKGKRSYKLDDHLYKLGQFPESKDFSKSSNFKYSVPVILHRLVTLNLLNLEGLRGLEQCFLKG